MSGRPSPGRASRGDQRVGQPNVGQQLAALEEGLDVAVDGVGLAGVCLVGYLDEALELGLVDAEGLHRGAVQNLIVVIIRTRADWVQKVQGHRSASRTRSAESAETQR